MILFMMDVLSFPPSVRGRPRQSGSKTQDHGSSLKQVPSAPLQGMGTPNIYQVFG